MSETDIIKRLIERLKKLGIDGQFDYNSSNGTVYRLKLSQCELIVLPQEILQLKRLDQLDLAGNRLTQLPKEIGQLQELQQLDLTGNQLTQLPGEIGQLKNLTKLYLIGIQLTQLPKEIGQLKNLTELYLNNNQLTQLPGEIGQLKKLTKLDLTGNQLTQLPKEIGQLKNLTELYLNNNQLTQLPVEIGQLQNLTKLVLVSNQLTQLPQEIGQLQNLTELNLTGNHLAQLPEEISKMINLEKLILFGNHFIQLPKFFLNMTLGIKLADKIEGEGIYIANNPLRIPPLEIIKQGRKALINYYDALEKTQDVVPNPEKESQGQDLETEESQEQDSEIEDTQERTGQPLNELKLLLLGDGGAGKTSLLKRLLGQNFDPNESQTHGINLNALTMDVPATADFSGGTIKLHCWDFGGQEMMHATHQFFLSKRSLYILVVDSRREAKTDYWLKHIENFGDKSPIIVVMNKIDENPSFDLPRQPLQKYHIAHFCRLSCRTGEGLDAFKQAIQSVIPKVDSVQSIFPLSWWQVKTALEQLTAQGKDYLSYDHYLDLCRQHDITTESQQRTLINFLHDLGLVIRFDQKLLRETNLINPKWLTEAIYKLITAPQVIAQQGILFASQLKELLDTRLYPAHKHDYLLELMRKFELSYTLSAGNYLIPDVLPMQEPILNFDYAQSLHFVLEYDFLPKSIMPRLMVRMHQDIQDNLQWRTGVVLYQQSFDSTALIQANDSNKCIHIYVTGQRRRDYLVVILFVLRDIHRSFTNLTVKEKICLPDNPEKTVSYTHLLNLEKQRIATYTPEDSNKVYQVKELLGTIHSTENEMLSILQKIQEELGKEMQGSILDHISIELPGISIKLKILLKKIGEWMKKSEKNK